jgi:hypothetical protein
MKNLILALALCVTLSCARAEDKPKTPDQWFNITDEGNKIVAAVNMSKNNEVTYYESKEKAFDVLFKGHLQYRKACEEALKPAPKEEPKKAEKKK